MFCPKWLINWLRRLFIGRKTYDIIFFISKTHVISLLSPIFACFLTIALQNHTKQNQQSGVAIDPAQQRAKVDSIVSANVKVIQDSVNTACSQRLAQEVPAKADSIVKAQKAAAATASPVKK